MKERIKSLDSMRGVAILAVLLIHTTTRTLEASNFNITGFSWTLFLNQVARFAVPFFILLSGFVLEMSFDPNMSYISFLKKRLSKILIPYIFWSVIYYFLIYNQNHENFIRVILTGNASYQLYFIPTLCVFYLLFPLLHKAYKIFFNKFVLLFLTILEIWLLYQDYFVKAFKLDDPIHIAILSYIFFVIGIVAAKNKDKITAFVNKWKYLILPATTVAGIYIFWEGRMRFLSTGNYLAYYSSWRPSIFIYTILISLSLYYLFEYTKLKESFVYRFSKHSFFVFFVHVIILEILWKFVGVKVFSITGDFAGKIIFDPVFFGIVALASFLIARYIHKIPKIQKLIG